MADGAQDKVFAALQQLYSPGADLLTLTLRVIQDISAVLEEDEEQEQVEGHFY